MFINKTTITLLMLFTLIISACNSKKDYLVTIKTSHGDIKLVLFEDTPLHRENFIKLAQSGRYDSTVFHRVIEGFMIQGGDVNNKEGTTPTPEAMIPAEIHPHHFHKKGALAAARTNNPQRKSSECQFYIVHGTAYSEEELTLDRLKLNQYFGRLLGMPEYSELREEVVALQKVQDEAGMEAKMSEVKSLIENEFDISLDKEISAEQLKAYTTEGGAPHLDGAYTVFGQVVDGWEVVDAIAGQKTDTADKPVEDIFMTVEVEKLAKSKITKKYGYQYSGEK